MSCGKRFYKATFCPDLSYEVIDVACDQLPAKSTGDVFLSAIFSENTLQEINVVDRSVDQQPEVGDPHRESLRETLSIISVSCWYWYWCCVIDILAAVNTFTNAHLNLQTSWIQNLCQLQRAKDARCGDQCRCWCLSLTARLSASMTEKGGKGLHRTRWEPRSVVDQQTLWQLGRGS